MLLLTSGTLRAELQPFLADSTYVQRLTYAVTVESSAGDIEPGAHDPMWSTDGEWIVYAETHNARTDLWQIRRMHPDGSEKTTLVENVRGNAESGQISPGPKPALSPDGAQLAYLSRGQVLVVNLTGSEGLTGLETRQLTTEAGKRGRPTFSPSGDRLAFLERVDSSAVVTLLDLEDGSVRHFEETAHSVRNLRAVHWADDPEQLIYADSRGVAHVDVASGQVLRSAEADADYGDPIVTPDGQWLLHEQILNDSRRGRIGQDFYLIDAGAGETGQGRRFIQHPWWRFANAGQIGSVDWSPDHRFMVVSYGWVFSNHRVGDWEIFVVDVEAALAVAPRLILLGDHVIRSIDELETLFPTDQGPIAYQGTLKISSTSLTDLAPMIALRQFAGSLEIADNPQLTSLAGLDSLVTQSPFGDFRSLFQIVRNPLLQDVSSLRRLHRVGTLYIQDNPSLDTLRLDRLHTASTIRIERNVSLRLVELPQWTGGGLWMSRNDSLETASFPAYGSVGFSSYGIDITNHPRLKTLTGFRRLDSVIFLNISGHPELSTLPRFESLRRTEEQLSISDNARITSLDAFPALEAVGSIPFHVEERPRLPVFNGAHLQIADNDSLRDISDLLDVVIVTWPNVEFRIDISGNPMLAADQVDSLIAQLTASHSAVVATTTDNGPTNDLPLDGEQGDAPPGDPDPLDSTDLVYPNPAHDLVFVRLSLPENRHRLQIDVFDILGQHVTSLTDAIVDGGIQTITWSCTNRRGQRVADGIYLIRCRIDGRTDRVMRSVVLSR